LGLGTTAANVLAEGGTFEDGLNKFITEFTGLCHATTIDAVSQLS